MDYYHVFPINDLIEHNLDNESGCQCNPEYQYDFENDNCIIVHDAIDRRDSIVGLKK